MQQPKIRKDTHDTRKKRKATNWAPVSEPGFLHFFKMFRNFGILGEFLKMVSKNGSAQYRRINIGRLRKTWFPIRRLMEPKNRP